MSTEISQNGFQIFKTRLGSRALASSSNSNHWRVMNLNSKSVYYPWGKTRKFYRSRVSIYVTKYGQGWRPHACYHRK